MISYDPADAINTLADGEYRATIEDVVPQISKKAAAVGVTTPNMHVVTLKVYEPDGSTSRVWDYITYKSAAGAGATWKLEQIADALGESAAFKAGKFDLEACVGKNLTVDLVTKTDDFGSKNVVREYVEAAPAKATGTDDAVPF